MSGFFVASIFVGSIIFCGSDATTVPPGGEIDVLAGGAMEGVPEEVPLVAGGTPFDATMALSEAVIGSTPLGPIFSYFPVDLFSQIEVPSIGFSYSFCRLPASRVA